MSVWGLGLILLAQSTVPPDVGGVLVVSSSTLSLEDPRLGALAARFAERGYEAVSAIDLARPAPDADRSLVRARWALDEARTARRKGRLGAAAKAGDLAIRLLESCAFESAHKTLLVQALTERTATAVTEQDDATAETLILRALALEPNLELDDLYSDNVRRLFSDVARAARQLPYGALRVEAPALPGATVSIDFGSPQDLPYETKLADGRHFVTLRAPGRTEVVAVAAVRTERRTLLMLRPPLPGDNRERAARLEQLVATDSEAIARLGRAAGLRFVALVELGRANLTATLFDAKSGQPVPNAVVPMSVNPGTAELDAAVTRLLESGVVVEPQLITAPEGPSWYTTWWGITLLGVAAVGATTATYFVATRSGDTVYRLDP